VQIARKKAEALEREGDWEGCGRLYRDIAATYSSSPRIDEVLYNAGVCFEEARSVGQAVAMYSQLRQRYPSSRLSQKALVREANLHAATARFEEAAELFESYAKRYGGEKDAPNALSNAIVYRRALGHYRKAVADVELYLRRYKRRRKREAAAVLFSLAGLYEAQGRKKDTAAILRRYLREFGRVGGQERVVIALARVGEVEWQESCPSQTDRGLCVRVRGTGKSRTFTPVARNRRRSAEAKRHFRKAVRAWQRLARTGTGQRYGMVERGSPTRNQALHWYLAARFHLADELFEELLRQSKAARGPVRDELVTELASIAAEASAAPVWRIASAARTGQLYLRAGQRGKAREAFRTCLDASMRASWFSEYSRLCETELRAIEPDQVPPLTELLAVPMRTPVLSRPGLLPDPR
jgi:tetratricopeptide (TPR) repeat protein